MFHIPDLTKIYRIIRWKCQPYIRSVHKIVIQSLYCTCDLNFIYTVLHFNFLPLWSKWSIGSPGAHTASDLSELMEQSPLTTAFQNMWHSCTPRAQWTELVEQFLSQSKRSRTHVASAFLEHMLPVLQQSWSMCPEKAAAPLALLHLLQRSSCSTISSGATVRPRRICEQSMAS